MSKGINTGIGKSFCTKHMIFRCNTTILWAYATFSLASFRIGWHKFWHVLDIHLFFVDIHIDWMPLGDKASAEFYIQSAKQQAKKSNPCNNQPKEV